MQDAPIEEIAQRRRDRARADLPPVLLQGGAVRPDGDRLPRASSTRCSTAAIAATRTPSSSSSAGRGPTPGSASATRRSWTARSRSCAGRRASCTTWSPSRSGCGSARASPRVHHVSQLLRRRPDAGVFDVEDPDYTANVLWTQTLGHDAPRPYPGRRQAGGAGDPGAVCDRARAGRRVVCGSGPRRGRCPQLGSAHDARVRRGSPRTSGARHSHQGRPAGRLGAARRGRGVRQDRRARARAGLHDLRVGALRRRRRGSGPAARADPSGAAHRAARLGRRRRRAADRRARAGRSAARGRGARARARTAARRPARPGSRRRRGAARLNGRRCRSSPGCSAGVWQRCASRSRPATGSRCTSQGRAPPGGSPRSARPSCPSRQPRRPPTCGWPAAPSPPRRMSSACCWTRPAGRSAWHSRRRATHAGTARRATSSRTTSRRRCSPRSARSCAQRSSRPRSPPTSEIAAAAGVGLSRDIAPEHHGLFLRGGAPAAFHPLFADVLRTRFERDVPPADRRAAHARVAAPWRRTDVAPRRSPIGWPPRTGGPPRARLPARAARWRAPPRKRCRRGSTHCRLSSPPSPRCASWPARSRTAPAGSTRRSTCAARRRQASTQTRRRRSCDSRRALRSSTR